MLGIILNYIEQIDKWIRLKYIKFMVGSKIITVFRTTLNPITNLVKLL